MSQPPPDEFADFSMMELFRVEAEAQVDALNAGLLAIERAPSAAKPLEALMRAAHSLKGAARIVNLPVIARVAHAMEDCFVAAQQGQLTLGNNETDVLLRGVDFFTKIARMPEGEIAALETASEREVEEMVATFAGLLAGASVPVAPAVAEELPVSAAPVAGEISERVVRVTVENVSRLLGLAGETLVESRRLQPLAFSMQRLKRLQAETSTTFDRLRDTLAACALPDYVNGQLQELSARLSECRASLACRIDELETFDRAAERNSRRLYQELLQVRMRPFGDGVKHLPRMARDLARSLGKEARLEITGENTQVDRDILEMLDAPLTHLLRNALDHGCEPADERVRAGKPAESAVRLDARHSAGVLLVTLADDGQGVDVERLRAALVKKNLVTAAVAEKLSEQELLEFLFLPGFSMRESVSEISGRGVGLDVVQDMVRSVRGKIRVSTSAGKGTQFQLQLPVTLSVVRALLVEAAGEPLALPLAQVAGTLRLSPEKLQRVSGRKFFAHEGELVGLTPCGEVLGRAAPPLSADELSIVLLGARGARQGMVVEKFLGQRELVVQPLDVRLGKVGNISAAAVLDDGTPVLIADVEDLSRSIASAQSNAAALPAVRGRLRGKILVADDSLTVREMHRQILSGGGGYDVTLALDGMEAWLALRAGDFDLLVTDVDMPRMDGLELVSRVRNDPALRRLPVVMVSHKDRPEDLRRGREAGADVYLTKSGFLDSHLLETVKQLLEPK